MIVCKRKSPEQGQGNYVRDSNDTACVLTLQTTIADYSFVKVKLAFLFTFRGAPAEFKTGFN